MQKPNLYEWYIKYLQNKPLDPNRKYHKHHIFPKHAGGLEDSELVVCTIRDHGKEKSRGGWYIESEIENSESENIITTETDIGNDTENIDVSQNEIDQLINDINNTSL